MTCRVAAVALLPVILVVLNIVSKHPIYQNIERPVLQQYRIELVLPSIRWHTRVFYAATERKLCLYQISKSYRYVFQCISVSDRTPLSFDNQHQYDTHDLIMTGYMVGAACSLCRRLVGVHTIRTRRALHVQCVFSTRRIPSTKLQHFVVMFLQASSKGVSLLSSYTESRRHLYLQYCDGLLFSNPVDYKQHASNI